MSTELVPRAELERTGSGKIHIDGRWLLMASGQEYQQAEDILRQTMHDNPDFEFTVEDDRVIGGMNLSWRRKL